MWVRGNPIRRLVGSLLRRGLRSGRSRVRVKERSKGYSEIGTTQYGLRILVILGFGEELLGRARVRGDRAGAQNRGRYLILFGVLLRKIRFVQHNGVICPSRRPPRNWSREQAKLDSRCSGARELRISSHFPQALLPSLAEVVVPPGLAEGCSFFAR